MEITRRRLALGGLTALGASALSGTAFATGSSALRDVHFSNASGATRVVLGLDAPAQARTFFLAGPDRFVVDLANARLALGGGQGSGTGPGGGMVRQYRYAVRPEGSVRLVLDLAGPAELVRQELGGRRDPAMSFDLASTGTLAAIAPREMLGRNGPRPTIVVDAGHGGRDPGAIGATSVREKDVVLDVALKLRDALRSRSYEVALTRDTDRFVELDERVRFARTHGASLFISIHADSHASRDAVGASVYTLSERGADRAQGMINAQNWNLDLGEAPRDGVAHEILVDLFQRETTNRSAQFAQTLIPRLGEVAPLLRNTHRNAGFFVLLAPDVPAVLVETGFLSNVADERRLNSSREREAMAEAMAGSVDAYFAGFQVYAARS
jgi:N-acetylmuramoyl-L-alanine amidase